MVTRPADGPDPLAERLRALGAEVIVQPAICISPPADWRPVDDALARLDEYDWLVFSSANGVRYLFDRLRIGVGIPPSERLDVRDAGFRSWRRWGRARPTNWRDTAARPISCPSNSERNRWPRRWRAMLPESDSFWPGRAAAAKCWPSGWPPPAPSSSRWWSTRSTDVERPDCRGGGAASRRQDRLGHGHQFGHCPIAGQAVRRRLATREAGEHQSDHQRRSAGAWLRAGGGSGGVHAGRAHGGDRRASVGGIFNSAPIGNSSGSESTLRFASKISPARAGDPR